MANPLFLEQIEKKVDDLRAVNATAENGRQAHALLRDPLAAGIVKVQLAAVVDAFFDATVPDSEIPVLRARGIAALAFWASLTAVARDGEVALARLAQQRPATTDNKE